MSYSRFDDEASYRTHVLSVIELAANEICIFDKDLVGMRAGASDFHAALNNFLAKSSTQSVRIVLHQPANVRNDMPRLAMLAERFSHSLLMRQAPDECRHLADCHVLADSRHGVRRFHTDHPRGAVIIDDEGEIKPWWNRFNELWEHSLPVNLIDTTGL